MAHISVCAKGHQYDSDVFPGCPICNGQHSKIAFGGETIGGGGTMPLSSGVTDVSGLHDQVFKQLTGDEIYSPNITKGGGTVPLEPPVDINLSDDLSGQTEPIQPVVGNYRNCEPVAGWLVCIEGPCCGKDYKLYARITHIGRSLQNDVCIPEDMTISADNHVSIGYDGRKNTFTMIANPAVKNPNYLNGEVVYTQAPLKPYDVLEVGKTKLVFVPFCCEHFQWGENK